LCFRLSFSYRFGSPFPAFRLSSALHDVSFAKGSTMETTVQKRRKYPRHRPPKGIRVAWKSGGRPAVSRADVVGMGGLFLHTSNPLALGSVIELLFELKTGDIRARASVRDSVPGRGMGLEFVQMQPDDRSRLNQFLSQYVHEKAEGRETSSTTIQSCRSAPAQKNPSRLDKGRSVRRCPFVASAEVIDMQSGMRLSARISELAVRGCYVDTLNPFPEGTIVTLRILKDEGVFETKAKVAYGQPSSGMGLTFTEMAPAQRWTLEGWLAAAITRSVSIA
jgi:hypothetical protein